MMRPETEAEHPCSLPQLWADVGGTFTDCFLVQHGKRQSLKVLSSGVFRSRLTSSRGERWRLDGSQSFPGGFWNQAEARLLRRGQCVYSGRVKEQSDAQEIVFDTPVPALEGAELLLELDAQREAPVLAAHWLLRVPTTQSLPQLDVRLGTTRGTNALLTRNGAQVGLVTTRGFKDCLEIGEQNRPDLFALTIVEPEPLTRHVLEVDERLDAQGHVLRPLAAESLRESLQRWFDEGIDSLAICLLHAHVNDTHERQIESLARDIGFRNVSVSSRVAPMIKLVARAETTVLDAYLTPVLAGYVQRLEDQFNRGRGSADAPRSRLRMMTSSGNLVEADAFRGGDSILSGPAGGVVALGKVAEQMAPKGVIGLDMGGTSTDVCRYAGQIPREYESRKAGVRVLVPMMAIHTVAAGGGSICDVRGGRMVVGPQSAGASPGPACYGRGGPLTVTDLNVILGRLPADRFPFPLDIDTARNRLAEVNDQLGDTKFVSLEAAAEGFLMIAVTHMAEAVRAVSTAQGADARELTLVGFGGAAGGHLCAVAEALAMDRLIDHRDASLLSALGMGLADVGRIRTRGVYEMLERIDEPHWKQLVQSVRDEAVDWLLEEERSSHVDVAARIQTRFEADLRYQGTEATLAIAVEPWHDLADRFHAAHRRAFGYDQPKRPIEVAAIRCEAVLPSLSPLDADCSSQVQSQQPGKPTGFQRVYMKGSYRDVPLYLRPAIVAGQTLTGPALVVDANSTLVIEADWTATMNQSGSFMVHRDISAAPRLMDQADQVTVEVVARRMQGIADSMGETLRRTAASVNIRQRLDYSCAIFTSRGELIANAPHVPVHLGAMGHTVREIMAAFPVVADGDVFVTNNPYAGGSHLPDVTVITPVFLKEYSDARTSGPQFFVASRAHHAEIGGKTPGSMPPDATVLGEEGVVIDKFALCQNGIDHTETLRERLRSGRYPSRDPETNLADIAAQRAAGILGSQYLQQLVDSLGLVRVNECVERLFQHADELVQQWINTLPGDALCFEDTLDDETRICVAWKPRGEQLWVDFSGTSPEHARCFNATPAIVTAATIYVLRCVIGGTLPMNDGIMRRIQLLLPRGLLNPKQSDAPESSPAVVAGNVETSMRVVDCLLGALGIAAASQGTMNNFLIGDTSFGYYETIGGGAGATAAGPGADGVHTHMTNTRITDPEVFEARYPVRLWRFELRQGSGGRGQHRGGCGLTREVEFLKPLSLSLLTNRRGVHRPWGLQGGEPGMSGENWLDRQTGETLLLPSCVALDVLPGDRLRLETPGGGGWGRPG